MNDKVIKKEMKKLCPQDGDCLIVFETKDFNIDNNVVIGKREAILLSYAYQINVLCEQCNDDIRSFIKDLEERAIELKKEDTPFEEFI